MENRRPTVGFEDGTTDVECLLVVPQDGHVSVDSVMRFDEKNTETVMDIQDVSRSFGVTSTGIAHKREDIFNGDVYTLHNEVEAGYFRMHNDFCSMGEEYLLGVELAESIANPNYVSSECLQTSVSDDAILASGSSIDSPWKADLFRIMEVPYCHDEELNVKSSGFGEIRSPCCESEMLIKEKPVKSLTSCTLRDITKFHDISSCSFQDILSDEKTSLPESVESSCCPKNEKNDESPFTGQNEETNGFHGPDLLVTLSSPERQSDALPTQKRSRKPTRRYIDELVDPIPRQSKRRREVFPSALKDKPQVVKDRKRCQTGSKAMRPPAEESAEEFSVKAIQVPFASLVHKECPKSPPLDMVYSSDRGNVITKPRNNRVSPAVHQMKRSENTTMASQKKKDEDVSRAHLNKRDECSTALHLMKWNNSVTEASHKRKDESVTGARLKRRNDHLTALNHKKRSDSVFTVSPKKDDCVRLVWHEKRDDYPSDESPEEVNGRRKHHRLWTIAEVKKLIDGVSEHGVGRWSRIKKLFFSASAHRTSVDLKDKWRNLLKASGMQGQCNHQGEKKRALAWRPLPKSILHRVCELANMYPYPKGEKPKVSHIHGHVSPDRSTDITLSDYRRILRSINGN